VKWEKNQLYCHTPDEWRRWLQLNHNRESEIWLIYLKGKSVDQEMTYDQSLDEALCYGWIDSLIRRIDEAKYARKFTPRKAISKWSESNRRRVVELYKQGRMTKAGDSIVLAAKNNGSWDRPDRPARLAEVPEAFLKALSKNRKAKIYFEALAPSHKERYLAWIENAKKQETKEKRIQESIRMLEDKRPLGLK
jgi:uncharacterized protein YdeI (YjbR/CyaY-like superfamily)